MNQKRPCPNEDHLSRCWRRRGEGGRTGGELIRSRFQSVGGHLIITDDSRSHESQTQAPPPHKDTEVGLFSRTLRGP